jgi:hypothetical protein
MAAKKTKKSGPGQLGEYQRKRDLGRSGEPAGGGRRARRKPRFVVQEHQASKGPAADPSQKRLAMPTEDHPLEYENFEGVIPEGEYGAGDPVKSRPESVKSGKTVGELGDG